MAEGNKNQPFDEFRLSLMQEILPMGLAVLDRARKGGASKVVEVFSSGSQNPLADLRDEGEPAEPA